MSSDKIDFKGVGKVLCLFHVHSILRQVIPYPPFSIFWDASFSPHPLIHFNSFINSLIALIAVDEKNLSNPFFLYPSLTPYVYSSKILS